jgi:hypothetical protein
MKRLIVAVIVLFLISSVSATLILLHPPKLDFSGNSDKQLCQKYSVFSDYRGNLIGNLRWSKKESKNLKDYNLNSSDLGIKTDFPDKIVSNNDKKDANICITFKDGGKYYGALLYNAENSPAGVGIWIYADVKGSKNGINFTKISEITGNAVGSLKNVVNDTKNQKALLVSSTTLLLFVLFILLLFVEKRIEKDYNNEEEKEQSIKKNLKKRKRSSK